MQEMIDAVSGFYKTWSGNLPASVDVLPQSGSDRRYFRLYGADGKTVIATVGANIPENETFMYFSRHFQKKELPVPTILGVNEDETIYLQ